MGAEVMKKSKFLVLKISTTFLIIALFSAAAIPKYLDLNRQNEANQCRANQIIVETALAIAYAESLSVGSKHYPEKLTEDMFENRQIPTCPIDGSPIQFDPSTGAAFCPHHAPSHSRTVCE